MKSCNLLRSLSTKLSGRVSPSLITPWPPARTAFDRWIESEIDELRLSSLSTNKYACATWLSKALDLAISSQNMFLSSVSKSRCNLNPIDKKIVDEYLEDLVQLLDACIGLRERMEVIKRYIESIYIALHWIEGAREPSDTAIRRALIALGSCEAVERRCIELEKCGSNLRKLGEKLARQCNAKQECSDTFNDTDGFNEALIGSRAVALLVVSMLGVAFSFKSRRGIPVIQLCRSNSWENSFHDLHKEVRGEFDRRRKDGLVALVELDATASAAKRMRDAIARRDGDELMSAAGALRGRCVGLEEKLRPFEKKVNELYRQLIGVRMSLLEIVH